MCVRTCMYVCICVCVYVYVCVYIHSYTCISTYLYTYVCMCVRMYACVYIYIYMYIGHFRRMCTMAEPYSVLYDWTQIICGLSGTIAAVAKERCLCDISCCLAMDQRKLQGSSSWTDIITLLQFHAVFIESTLECYMLKEGWGTPVPSYETVHKWMNTIQNGRKDRRRPSQCSPNNGNGWMLSGKVISFLEHTLSIW
jgi:nuclear pore complex protein Nup62